MPKISNFGLRNFSKFSKNFLKLFFLIFLKFLNQFFFKLFHEIFFWLSLKFLLQFSFLQNLLKNSLGDFFKHFSRFLKNLNNFFIISTHFWLNFFKFFLKFQVLFEVSEKLLIMSSNFLQLQYFLKLTMYFFKNFEIY